MNDAFGTPFEGWIDFGWDRTVELVSCRHALKWRPGTRSMTEGVVTLTDSAGGEWRIELQVPLPPHVIGQVGYHIGAWHDGGTIATWHGRSPALEWDEFDFSVQPFKYTPYKVTGAAAAHTFNLGSAEGAMIHGPEYLARVTTFAPDGSVSVGASQIELFIAGRYTPYGFE